MNQNLINMLEDIKASNYQGVMDYINPNSIQTLRQWYAHFTDEKHFDDERLVSLMYELYIMEDIDFRPYEEYQEIVSLLADKYHFHNSSFLKMYQQFRMLLFGERNGG